jgi:hypothetical protein
MATAQHRSTLSRFPRFQVTADRADGRTGQHGKKASKSGLAALVFGQFRTHVGPKFRWRALLRS